MAASFALFRVILILKWDFAILRSIRENAVEWRKSSTLLSETLVMMVIDVYNESMSKCPIEVFLHCW